MIALGWAVNLVQRGAASMGRINQLFRRARRPSPSPRRRSRCRPPVAAARWSFETCGSRIPARASGVRCCRTSRSGWRPGRSLAVVGATGSGKSTLVDLLVRAYDPDRGAMLIDGVDIRRLPLAELRRAVGFVPQETFLFSETLRENVLLGAPDDGRLERVAEVAQLTEALPALPNGYDTMLGERGINLSGGQKQRSRDRPRAGAGPAGLRAGRRAERGGRADRGQDPSRAARRAGRAHEHHRVAPAGRGARRRLDSGARRGPDRGAGRPRRPDRARGPLLGAAAPAAAGGGAGGGEASATTSRASEARARQLAQPMPVSPVSGTSGRELPAASPPTG